MRCLAKTLLMTLFAALAASVAWGSSPAPAAQRNQVFQFMYTATRSDWADGAKTTATAYLWIPEHCEHLRGLIVMGTNVPEQMLAGNAEIRAAAAANDLGIVWSSPTFWYSKAKNEDPTVVAFLQQLLDGLAQVSGYEEVATVPWLPIGESGHLLMVDALVEAAPERCIAGIWLKNPHLPPHNRSVPALVIYGTAQEWGQDKAEYTTLWVKNTDFYDRVIQERTQNPDWPLTFLIDGGSGHFDVSAQLVTYVAHYISAVSRARLAEKPGSEMQRIDLHRGFLADLPVPKHTGGAVQAYDSVAEAKRGLPWYFDRQSAAEAQAIASIDWQAQSQLIGFEDSAGRVAPFDFNGISSITPQMDADGITFHLRPVLLDKLPENFLHAGEPLAMTKATPTLEWMCGAVEQVGGDALQVSMDRGYRQQAIYFVGRAAGADNIRAVTQPIAIKLQPNHEGAAQHIRFEPLKDVNLGVASVGLTAVSDQGLPVRFFVVAGPAKIEGGRLVLTAIPPRTKFPVEVTVAAWQWGRSVEPKVQTAETVRQTFEIRK